MTEHTVILLVVLTFLAVVSLTALLLIAADPQRVTWRETFGLKSPGGEE